MLASHRRLMLLGVMTLAAATLAAPASACPFCTMQGTTLTGDVEQASLVLFGTLANPKLDAGGDFGGGTTELHIESVIKKHDILGDKKVLTIPRYIPVDKDKTIRYLVFCDVFKGKVDPYRGVAVKNDSDIVKYLTGALAVQKKEVGTRLRYYFDYLANPDIEISNDAYKEFGNADYKDFQLMAKGLPADKIAGWLEDKDTPSFRYGLYASMLGHCGQEKHADVLKRMLDDPKKTGTGIDGILAGHTMLKPKEGWENIRKIMKDESKEFMLRYAALRAARFFWESRPDVIQKKDIIDGVCLLLDDGNIADLAIEDLRKWSCWDVTDRVLGLYGKKTHDVPIVRRAILRFALSVPGDRKESKAAAEFVKAMVKKDAEWVQDVKELLDLETAPPPPEKKP